jgi:hypothetical protein
MEGTFANVFQRRDAGDDTTLMDITTEAKCVREALIRMGRHA